MVENKPAPAAASATTVGDGTNRLRMTRTATLFALTTLLYFGSIIFYGASRATTPAERYVTGGDALYVEVAGCDVRVESGPRNEVDVERWIWHWAEVRWFYRSGGAKVWKVIVRNVVGCHNAPFFECDETCEVRVRVADGSARLVVRQGASDAADHLKVRVDAVALASLDVSGNFDVSIKNVAVAGAAKISTTDGSVAIADSDLGQGGGSCRVKSARGSVAIAESRDVVDDLAVAYRSVNKKTCFALAQADGDRVLRICSEPVVLGDGALGRRKGLVGEFNEQRRDAGLPAVDLREHLGWLADEFDLAVETEMKLSVDGLRLRNFAAGGKKLKLSGSFYVEHVLTAMAHFACLVVPVVLLCSVAMHLQLRHSKLWAAVVGDGAERFWSIYDATLVEDFVLSGDARVFASAFMAAYAGLYFLAAVARVYFHYAGDGIYSLPPAPERLVSCVRLVFAVLCVGAAFLFLFYAFLVAVWLLAGAILDPAKLSSRSVAFFTLCTSISALRQQLAAAAAKHENLIYERLRSRVADALESYSKAREATQKQIDGATGVSGVIQAAEASVTSELSDAQRLFAALDGNNSGGVTADEIRELAAVAALPELDDAKLAQIFAYADADLDAVVDADEFDRAWTWVERQIVDASLERAGLGPRFVNAAVAGAAVLLAGAFVFLFLVFAAWSEGSTFAACVESLLVLSAGFAVRGLGPSAAAVMPEAVVRRGGGAKKAV